MKKQYSLEFKRQVIKQALEADSVGTIARKYQINSITVCRWIREFKQGKYAYVK
ncbi:transposase [Aneurinibacillus terranovensis]|uniref:transposase n=1 Tax=Aneurinibacillus terranovensis TaxID=278991 RepID=UPI00041F3B78|nr:helix-turn-helix domain-containing protein [Aneurinibacillus terranovensis]